jgi:predicted nucleotidyltransferase
MGSALSLMQLSVLENRVAEILGSEVDLVPDSALRPDLRERILAEAVLL